MTTTSDDSATPRQLAYLRQLAERAGQTFSSPRTKAQASSEICRLKAAEASTSAERRAERLAVICDLKDRPSDSCAVRPHEIEGFGSTATWKGRS